MIELSVDDLHLDYGDNPVLKGCVSMALKQGEKWCRCWARPASGKTTLLRAVAAGLEAPKRGKDRDRRTHGL